MRARSKAIQHAVCIGFGLVSAGTLHAAGNSVATVAVSAVVQRSAILRVETPPVELSIDAADIKRGYIDVPAATLFSVTTGRSAASVVLDVGAGHAMFKSIEVRMPGQPPSAAAGRSLPSAQLDKSPATFAVMAYRLHLSERARIGRVSLPLVLDVYL